jgi:hypothetical protein
MLPSQTFDLLQRCAGQRVPKPDYSHYGKPMLSANTVGSCRDLMKLCCDLMWSHSLLSVTRIDLARDMLQQGQLIRVRAKASVFRIASLTFRMPVKRGKPGNMPIASRAFEHSRHYPTHGVL